MPRGTAALAALAAILTLAAPGLVGAQVAAPRMVEDDDPEEPVRPPAEAPAQPAPPAPGAAAAPAAPRGGAAPAAPPSPGGSPAAAPAVGPPSNPTPEPARRIIPVRTSWAKLMAAAADRRKALREADPAGADASQKAMLAAQRELGIDNLLPLAATEVRAVARALASNLPAEALGRAEVAVSLAPDWPEAHLARARALLATSTGGLGPALGAAADAGAAALRDPQTVRAFRGDLLAALLAALAAAGLLTLLLPALRALRLLLHDFHHLPLLRGTAGAQATFLALVLLALPVVLGLGPLAVAATWLTFTWLYLSLRERLVASAVLLLLFALPWGAERAAALTVWTGTLAEHVHLIEHGALSDEEAAAEVKALGPAAPAPLLAALGRHMKRRGDLDTALRLYREAAAADPRAAEILVNIGNVLFLEDDLEGARASYLAAQDRAEGDLIARGTAAYDLSKLFIRSAEMEKSSAARANAEQMAGGFLAGRGSDEDFSANRYLVDVPVSAAKIAALAASDPAPATLRASAQVALLRPAAGAVWPWVAAGLLALLWGLSLAGQRLDPCRRCHRCGRPVCRRCDGATGRACGQCVNVYEKRGVVEARDQLRKERQVRRYAAWRRAAARALSLLLGGGGHLVTDAPLRGLLFTTGLAFCAFLVWFWPGVTPPPYPSPHALLGKVAVAVPLGLAIWLWAVRDLFRRTRG
jgi:tetratricopeptide (TPR) repeat protein